MTENPPEAFPEYTAPQQGLSGFHCPNCGVYSRQIWFQSARLFETPEVGEGANRDETRVKFGLCDRCHDLTVWRDGKMIYPLSSTAPRAHKDMPPEVARDYQEARLVLVHSPRAAAALLRLATEKLALHLVNVAGLSPGKDLNENIGLLVKAGLPGSVQKALDSLRVIGNEAVHPGMLDLKDDAETALRLFKLLNIIVENRITETREIETLYAEKIPDTKKDQIERRDATC